MSVFTDRLKEMMDKRGMSQRELAEAVDIIKEAHAKTDRLLEEVLAEREQNATD